MFFPACHKNSIYCAKSVTINTSSFTTFYIMIIDILELGKQKNFCILPFIAIQTYLIGGKLGLSPCCKMHSLVFSDLEDNNFDDVMNAYFNNGTLQSVKQSFLDGKIPKLCSSCFIDADNVLYPREKYNNFTSMVNDLGANPTVDTDNPSIKVVNLAS